MYTRLSPHFQQARSAFSCSWKVGYKSYLVALLAKSSRHLHEAGMESGLPVAELGVPSSRQTRRHLQNAFNEIVGHHAQMGTGGVKLPLAAVFAPIVANVRYMPFQPWYRIGSGTGSSPVVNFGTLLRIMNRIAFFGYGHGKKSITTS